MTSDVERMRILVITGSVRPGNYTLKASALVVDELRKDPMVRAELVDPQTLDLPLPGTRAAAEATRHLQQKVKEAAGVVLATPEYHGSFSSVMKLVIENLGYPSVLSGKPVALLGVAAGAIGAIKSLEQLRGVCSHIGAIALPLPALSLIRFGGHLPRGGYDGQNGIKQGGTTGTTTVHRGVQSRGRTAGPG